MIINGETYPNWTVIGHTGDLDQKWVGIQYHFTDDEKQAGIIYEILGVFAVVKRPFDKADIPFLRGV